jgi:hypothetical protein
LLESTNALEDRPQGFSEGDVGPDDQFGRMKLLDARSRFVTGQVLYMCVGVTVGVAGV